MPDLENFKTSRDDFKLFKARFMELVEQFGLQDWDIDFRWGELDECVQAAVTRNVEAHSVFVHFAKSWPIPATKNEIQRKAAHEFCHLWLSELEGCAVRRYVTEYEIEVIRERLARQFESVFHPVKH